MTSEEGSLWVADDAISSILEVNFALSNISIVKGSRRHRLVIGNRTLTGDSIATMALNQLGTLALRTTKGELLTGHIGDNSKVQLDRIAQNSDVLPGISLALAPEGNWLAYILIKDLSGAGTLVIRNLSTGEQNTLCDDAADTGVVWGRGGGQLMATIVYRVEDVPKSLRADAKKYVTRHGGHVVGVLCSIELSDGSKTPLMIGWAPKVAGSSSSVLAFDATSYSDARSDYDLAKVSTNGLIGQRYQVPNGINTPPGVIAWTFDDSVLYSTKGDGSAKPLPNLILRASDRDVNGPILMKRQRLGRQDFETIASLPGLLACPALYWQPRPRSSTPIAGGSR